MPASTDPNQLPLDAMANGRHICTMRIRPSTRLLVVNQEQCLLLFHFVHREGPLAGDAYWPTPGGGLESSESFVDAARRALREETGIVANVGAEVAQRHAVCLPADGEKVQADERYFLVSVANERRDSWSHFTNDGGGLRYLLTWHPIDEPTDEDWDPVFPRARAFIRHMLARPRVGPARHGRR